MRKAVLYVLQAIVVVPATMLAGVAMYLSRTFVPVYAAGTYILANQIVRYALYAGLLLILIASMALACNGAEYLSKRFRRALKRRR